MITDDAQLLLFNAYQEYQRRKKEDCELDPTDFTDAENSHILLFPSVQFDTYFSLVTELYQEKFIKRYTTGGFFLEQKGIAYIENLSKPQSSPTIIHVGTVAGNAIIGNQQNATMNIGMNLDQIRDLISQKPIEDQDALNKLMDRLDMMFEENQPIQRGFFSKFSDVLSRHSDIAVAIWGTVHAWLLGGPTS